MGFGQPQWLGFAGDAFSHLELFFLCVKEGTHVASL